MFHTAREGEEAGGIPGEFAAGGDFVVVVQAVQRQRGVPHGGELLRTVVRANDRTEFELRMERLKEEFSTLRRSFRTWLRMVRVALAILLVLGGGFWGTLFRQHADVTQKRAGSGTNSANHSRNGGGSGRWIAEELANLNPEIIQAALRKTIEENYQRELQAAEQFSDWKTRDNAKQEAAAARDQRLRKVDEFLVSITGTIQPGEASPEFFELTRILKDQSVEEALAYIASQECRRD